MKRIKYIPAFEHSECALSCIVMICLYYKNHTNLTMLREEYGVPQGGFNISQIINIFKNIGLETIAVKVNILESIKEPFIAYYGEDHFVVVEKVTKKSVIIIDPTYGKIKLQFSEFMEKFSGIAILVAEDKSYPIKKKINWSLKDNFILIMINRHKKILLFILLLSLGVQIVSVIIPSFIKMLLDFTTDAKITQGTNIFISIGILAFIYYALNVVRRRLITKMQNIFDKELTESTVAKILNLPLKFFINRGKGELLFTINSNQYIRVFLSSNVISICIDLIFSFFYCYLMFQYSPYLTLITIIISILLFIITLMDTKFLLNKNQQQLRTINENQNIVNEIISNIETIKSVNAEQNMFKKWSSAFSKQFLIETEKTRVDSLLESLPLTISIIFPLIIYSVGIRLGNISVGSLVAFNTLSMSFLIPILSIADSYFQLISSKVYIQQLLDVLKSKEESKGSSPGRDIKIDRGEIVLENISYKYDYFSKNILSDISLSIKSNEKVAIVGESGSGKSTLLKIIAGLLVSEQGKIIIDGQEINDNINKKSYRKSLGILLQNNSLFNGSIKNNIELGREVKVKDILKATKQADLEKFLNSLPAGLNTIISESGRNISGGQIQKICIARSLIFEPKILLMDEPTSSLDQISDEKIIDSLLDINSTIIIISHRLSNMKKFDKILVMSDGKLIAQGNHDFLLRTNEHYKYLVSGGGI